MSRTKLTQNSISSGAINANTMFAADVISPHAIANTSTYSVGELLVGGTILLDNTGVITGPSSITSTAFVGALTGNVTGNASGTAATVTTAAQPNITSLGTIAAFRSTGIDDNAAALAMTIDSSGSLGINRTNPSSIVGSTAGGFVLQDGGRSASTTQFAVLNSSGISSFSLLQNATASFSGNVGIGTTSPSTKLHTVGTGLTTGIHYLGSVGATGGTAGELYFGGVSGSVNGMRIHNKTGNALSFATAAGTKITMTDAGLVGIGTTSPGEELHIVSAAPTIKLEDSDNSLSCYINGDNGNALIQSYNANRDIIFGENAASAELMRVTGLGKVGIGVTAPTEKLTVHGAIRSTSASADFTAGVAGMMIDMASGIGRIGTVSGTSALTGDVQFIANNAEKMRIKANGNVGIGTTTAIRSGVLSVDGIISTDANIYFGASGNGRLYSDVNWGLIFTADRASPAAAEFMWENAGGDERMRISPAGKVGIGTTSPSLTLDVRGSGVYAHSLHVGDRTLTNGFLKASCGWDGVIRLNSGSASTIYVNREVGATRDFHIWNGTSTSIMTVQGSTARVGIGTTSPAGPLHVHGYIHQTMVATGSTALGYNALDAINSSGTYNTAIGYNTLSACTDSVHNIAIGASALAALVSGAHYNIGIGHNAGATITSGDYNILMGYYSGHEISSGLNNIAIGGYAGRYFTTASNNTFLGYAAGHGHSTAKGTGSSNVAVGYSAFYSATTHTGGTFVGLGAGYGVTSGSGGTFVGYHAGYYQNATVNNTHVGILAGQMMNGSQNTSIGHTAMRGYTTTPANNTGTYNVAIGYAAMQNDLNSATGITAHHNTVLGSHAADSNTSGGQNVIIGHNAAGNITASASNCIIGFQAALEMRAGSANNALGRNAMHNMNTGTHNQAIGYTAMYGRAYASGGITGHHNVAIAHNSLYYIETSSHNTAVGYATGHRVTTGAQNTVLGSHAGQWIRTGSNNVHIGMYAGGSGDVGTSQAHDIFIGYNTRPSGNSTHEIVIGTNSETGKGNSTGFITPASGGVYQGNNSSAWSTTSDRRIKKNIIDNNIGLDAINQIRVRNFEYRQRDEIIELSPNSAIDKKGVQLGVIAQEIQPILPDVVKEESTGCLSVNPDNMTWYLVNAVKELSAKVDELTTELEELKNGS